MGAKYIANNKEKIKLYQKQYREKNKDKNKIYQKTWRINNQDKIKSYTVSPESIKRRNCQIRYKYATNTEYRLKHIIRVMVSRTCKALKTTKRNKSLKYIGCTIDELKLYIESKFKPGMSWDNYGLHGWHLDHIKPLCSFTADEMLIANHYTNLQPLWSIENLSKGGNY